MKESEYDRIEKQSESGIKVCLEFPRRTGSNDAKIAQEIKEILSGSLWERIGRTGES